MEKTTEQITKDFKQIMSQLDHKKKMSELKDRTPDLFKGDKNLENMLDILGIK